MTDQQNAMDNSVPSFEREMANYQAAVSKQAPASTSGAPVDPRYQAERDAFAKATGQKASQPTPQPAAPAASTSRDADIASLQMTMGTINPATGQRYAADSRVQAALERSLASVLEGKPLDRAALKAELQQLAGIKAPAAAEPAEAVPPQGTPEDRAAAAVTAAQTAAINEILPRIDADGGIEGRHLPPVLTAGFVLPDNIVFDAEETIAMCAVAKAAGFTQADVDRYIEAQR